MGVCYHGVTTYDDDHSNNLSLATIETIGSFVAWWIGRGCFPTKAETKDQCTPLVHNLGSEQLHKTIVSFQLEGCL